MIGMLNMIKRSILLVTLLFFLGCFGGVYAEASFVVAPTRLVFNLRQGQTQPLILKNTGDQLIHLTVRPVFYPASSKVLDIGKPLNPQKEAGYNLMPYVLYSPHVVSLRPGEQRDIRVMVETPKAVKTGEYRAHLLIHMAEPATFKSRISGPTDTKKIGIELKMLMQVAVPIYGEFGSGKAKLNVHCQKNSKGFLQFYIVNKTPWHFDGDVWVMKKNTAKAIVKIPLVLMRESKKTVTLPIKPEKKQTYHVTWKPTQAGFGISGDMRCSIK